MSGYKKPKVKRKKKFKKRYQFNGQQFSKAEIKWLVGLEKSWGVYIQHALKPGGQINIPGVGKVDGFCSCRNPYTGVTYSLVLQFYGDYWHGNPKFHSPESVHMSGKTFGELYQRTLDQEKKIKELGYTLFTVWEHEFQAFYRKQRREIRARNKLAARKPLTIQYLK